MLISHLFNLFIAASFAGWIYECAYCTVRTTRWQNRGFLFGPICPIYGAGFIGAFLVFASDQAPWADREWSWPAIFFICALGSAVLEYVTSYLLEKLFHARWWDYSYMPLNLNGRICLPATLGFGAAGLLIVRVLIPFLNAHVGNLQKGLAAPVEELISLLLMCVLGVDLGLSVSAVTSLLEKLERMEAEFDEIMESRYAPIGKTQRNLAGSISEAKQTVAGTLSEARVVMTESLSEAKQTVTGTLSGAKQTVTGTLSGAKQTVTGTLSEAKQAVSGSLSGAGQAMTDRLEGLGEYKTAFLNHVEGLSGFQKNTLMNIASFSSGRHTRVASRMKFALKRDRSEEQKPEAAQAVPGEEEVQTVRGEDEAQTARRQDEVQTVVGQDEVQTAAGQDEVQTVRGQAENASETAGETGRVWKDREKTAADKQEMP